MPSVGLDADTVVGYVLLVVAAVWVLAGVIALLVNRKD